MPEPDAPSPELALKHGWAINLATEGQAEQQAFADCEAETDCGCVINVWACTD